MVESATVDRLRTISGPIGQIRVRGSVDGQQGSGLVVDHIGEAGWLR